MKVFTNVLFSQLLSNEELAKVNIYSYFFLLENDEKEALEYKLLPSDHAIAYPLEVVEKPKKTIKEGGLNFYNEVIYNNYRFENFIDPSKISIGNKVGKSKDCIVINLVDNCFGHSFLKLYGIYTAYLDYADKYDLVILAPKSLAHFLPNDKGLRIILIDLGFTEAMNCYCFGNVLKQLRQEYATVDFLVMDTYKALPGNKLDLIDFFNFFGDLKGNERKKCICFFYRRDFFRSWNGESQAKNIQAFFELIRPYFTNEIEFYVIGEKDNNQFSKWIHDLRIDNYSKEYDYLYNHIFYNSIISVGVMGSAMTQSSLFAPFSVYLVAENKTSVIAQDLPNCQTSSVAAYFENMYIYGNAKLNDLTPEVLKNRIMLLYFNGMAIKYKCSVITNLKQNYQSISQSVYFESNYNFVNLTEVQKLKESISKIAFKKMMPNYIWHRLKKKLLSF